MSDLNFDKWNKKKKDINSKNRAINFNEKEIFMAYVGKNIGFEQNGDKQTFLRPLLVYKKFSGRLFLAIPLTKTQKNSKFYYNFKFKKDTTSTAILSQIKLIDSRRLQYRMGKIKDDDYKQLVEKLKKLILPLV